MQETSVRTIGTLEGAGLKLQHNNRVHVQLTFLVYF